MIFTRKFFQFKVSKIPSVTSAQVHGCAYALPAVALHQCFFVPNLAHDSHTLSRLADVHGLLLLGVKIYLLKLLFLKWCGIFDVTFAKNNINLIN